MQIVRDFLHFPLTLNNGPLRRGLAPLITSLFTGRLRDTRTFKAQLFAPTQDSTPGFWDNNPSPRIISIFNVGERRDRLYRFRCLPTPLECVREGTINDRQQLTVRR